MLCQLGIDMLMFLHWLGMSPWIFDMKFKLWNIRMPINPQAPVAQKITDEMVFRRFQGEGVEFFKNRTSLTPLQFFDAHLLENTDLTLSRFHYSVGFITRSCFESNGYIAYSNEWYWREKTIFIQTNQPLFTSFYIKKNTNFLAS